MELRSLEKDVDEMASLYESLRHAKLSAEDKELVTRMPSILFDNASLDHENKETKAKCSLAEVLSTLESISSQITELHPKMDRYRKRLSEKDPVTEAPRYGDSTRARVSNMLTTFDALTDAIRIAFGEAEPDNTDSDKSAVIVKEMHLAVQKQEEAARRMERELAERTAQKEAERKEKEKVRLEQERQAEEAALLSQRREREKLAQLADEARRNRQAAEQAREQLEQRAREEAERADREWVASISKGPDGVRQQLTTLRESTDEVEYVVALNALHTLFSQTVSHPEETKFRRVRRDHRKFNEDIGRHTGGREVLIAAGFRLGAIDNVPSFISTEPNIEKDMDGWSEWFDTLKSTLEILEEELIKPKV